jgi:hypothetical protein
MLVAGVAFKKTFSYAGFEMQPKTYTKPQIALLNIELELKAERDNAEVRVDNVEVRSLIPSFQRYDGHLCTRRTHPYTLFSLCVAIPVAFAH